MKPWMLWVAAALFLLWFLRPSMPRSARMDALQVRAALDSEPQIQLIDVRTPAEFKEGHIKGASLLPLQELETRMHEIDQARPVILVCRSGNRSGRAYKMLTARGYGRVGHLEGGMLRWAAEGLPVVR